MIRRRKNPTSAGFYLALIAGGALVYALIKNRSSGLPAVSLPPVPSGTSTRSGGSTSTRPTKGCNGLPLMPSSKATQLQKNLNAYFAKAGVAQADVDGDFGYWSARLVDYYRAELAPLAEAAQRTPTADPSGYRVLKDATIFYDPITDDTVSSDATANITFDLVQRGCDQPPFVMRRSLYDKLSSSSFTWSQADISVAGLTPAVNR